MAKAKRTKAQREADLVFIEPLYVRGYSRRAIADELSKGRDYTLTPRMIGYDIEEVLDRWREATIKDVDQAKMVELSKLAAVEREAWLAWDRSKSSREATLNEKRTGQAPGEKARITRETQTGDPRYLQTIQTCIDRRCKLLGLDGPLKIQGALGITTLADLVKAASTHVDYADIAV